MKISGLTIYDFGKWHQFSVPDISSMALFYGENEAGKSTIIAFIHSVLFGFPTKRSQVNRYEPKEGASYGGRLFLTDTVFGSVTVERIKQIAGREELTIFFEDGRKGNTTDLAKILGDLDEEMYRSIFSFSLFGIQGVHQIRKADFNRYFMSIGLSGSDKYMISVDNLAKKREALYKPKGRLPVINKQLFNLKQMKERMEHGKEKNSAYMNLLQEQGTKQEGITTIQAEIKTLNEQSALLEKLKNHWALYEEYVQLSQVLGDRNSHLTQEMIDEYQEKTQELVVIHKQIGQLKEQEIALTDEKESVIIEENQEEPIQTRLEEWPIIRQLEEDKKVLQEEVMDTEKKIQELCREQQIQLDKLPQEIVSDTFKKQLKTVFSHFQDMQQQLEMNELREEQLADKINQGNQQITQIERHMISKELFHKWAQIYEKNENHNPLRSFKNEGDKNSRNRSKNFMPLFVAIIAFAGGVFTTGLLQVLLFIGSFGLLGGFGYLYWRNQTTKASKEEDVSGYSYEAYEKQRIDREQYQELNFQMDQLQEDLEEEKQKKNMLSEKQMEYKQELFQLKQKLYLSEEVSLEQLEEKAEAISQLQVLQEQVEQKTEQVNEKNNQIQEWLLAMKELTQSLELNWSFPEASVEKIRHILSRQQEQRFTNVGKNKQQQQVLLQKNELLEKQTKLEQELALVFQQGQVKDEADFKAHLRMFFEKKEQSERREMLKSQLELLLPSLGVYQEYKNILEEIEKKDRKLEQLRHTLNQELTEKAHLSVEKEGLEEGRDYTRLLQQYGNEKEQLRELSKEWLSYQLAGFMIERTLTIAQQERLPQTLNQTSLFMSQLTLGNYTEVSFVDENLLIRDKKGEYWSGTELSQGTAEQLYLAIRLAFIVGMNDTLHLPIIIDDGFVHFDEKRKTAAFKLLRTISETNQVLYFSCQKENLRYFSQEEQLHLLDSN